jgi:hypothetical protein
MLTSRFILELKHRAHGNTAGNNRETEFGFVILDAACSSGFSSGLQTRLNKEIETA